MLTFFNYIVFLSTGLFVSFLVLTGQPVVSQFEGYTFVLALFRVGVGAMVIIRTARSFDALPLLFGYENVYHSSHRANVFRMTIVCGVFVVLGIATDISSLVLFILYVYQFRKSKYFSIEDIYFQNTLLHLPFLAAGSFLSVDDFIGVTPLLSHHLMYSSLFLSNGLILFSAGYEKLKSPMWREGRGSGSFLSLPHLGHRTIVKFVEKRKGLLKPLSYLVMLAELSYVFACTNEMWFLLNTIVLSGFAVSLFTIVDLSFIGQILLLNLGLFGILSLQGRLNVDFSAILTYDLLPVVILINLWIILIVTLFPGKKHFASLVFLQRHLNGVVSQIGVFTERHLFGLFTFRLHNKDGQVLSVFDETGFQGSMQRWEPRFYQGAMYPVTDYCLMAVRKKLLGTQNTRFFQIVDLCFAGLNRGRSKHGRITLSVKKIDHDETSESYRSQSWKDIVTIDFRDSGYVVENLGNPPLIKKSDR
jgi:hypothetical protein